MVRIGRIPYLDEDGKTIGSSLPAHAHSLKLVFHDDPMIPPEWRAVCPDGETGCVRLHDETATSLEDCWVDTWVTEGYAVGGSFEIEFNASWELDIEHLTGWATGIRKIEMLDDK